MFFLVCYNSMELRTITSDTRSIRLENSIQELKDAETLDPVMFRCQIESYLVVFMRPSGLQLKWKLWTSVRKIEPGLDEHALNYKPSLALAPVWIILAGSLSFSQDLFLILCSGWFQVGLWDLYDFIILNI